MSSTDYTDTCARCDQETLEVCSESRPHEQATGICLSCGLVFFPIRDLAGLARVNEERKLHDLPPLTKLMKPTEEWLKNWGDPNPEKRKRR